MRVIRGVAGLGLVVLLALGGALPASGGGPTSVLIVAPENQKAAALYTTQPEYGHLQAYVDEAARPVEVVKPDHASPHESGRTVRLTWLIHDTTVWRTDTIHLTSAGGPWIATRLADHRGNSSLWEQPVRWHTSSEPKRLMALLGKLGVLTKSGSADGGYVVQTPPVPQPQAQPEPQPAAAVQDESVLTGWRWVIPGFAAGAVLMLLAVKLGPAWQRRDRSPRVQLID